MGVVRRKHKQFVSCLFDHLAHRFGAQLQARQLKVAGEVTHILAGEREEIHAPLGQFAGLGSRKIAAVTDDDAILEPTGQRIKQFAVIDRSGGQRAATQSPGVGQKARLHTVSSPSYTAGLEPVHHSGPPSSVAPRYGLHRLFFPLASRTGV